MHETDTDIPKKTKSMLRHSFVRGLSSISEYSESNDINDDEKVQWMKRHNSSNHAPKMLHSFNHLPFPCGEGMLESGVSRQQTVMNQIPQFSDGRRPRYRLIHIDWKWKKNKFKLKGTEKVEGLKKFKTDIQGIFRSFSEGDTQNCVPPHTSRKISDRKHRKTKETKSSRKTKLFSIQTTENSIDNESNSTDNNVPEKKSHSGKKGFKVMTQITSLKKKMRFKAGVIDKLNKRRSKCRSFSENPESSETLSERTLSPTWSQDSELDDVDSTKT